MAIEQRMTGLIEAIAIQSQEGNWNRNKYMRGLANGLILARSILEGRKHDMHAEPHFYMEDEQPTDEAPVDVPMTSPAVLEDDYIDIVETAPEPAPAPAKRGPGRPRKNPVVAAAIAE